ncbi:unnamed protein product [Toxocara canis]|uniref:MoaD/ThiS family protein n=1 Tax=Toxocara canis TaxID=6265 RepID=A0A183U4F2_TOXCA|nr:unnamed protein product [Toxocara canis]
MGTIKIGKLISGRIIETADKVQPLPRQKLHECLDAKLRQWGLSPEYVAFFVENSRTPLPDNCDAGYLAGHRIVVREQYGVRSR